MTMLIFSPNNDAGIPFRRGYLLVSRFLLRSSESSPSEALLIHSMVCQEGVKGFDPLGLGDF
jgi:hypothetical protein